MQVLGLEVTTHCNRACLHCMRTRTEPRRHLPLPLTEHVLRQARALGIREISLTGGEVSLHPELEALIDLIVDMGFRFNLVTNGAFFADRLLAPLSRPRVRKRLGGVCISLDGAGAQTHDALRGSGSFREVMKAATLCRARGLPLALKSLISTFNRSELTELALLGAALGARSHGFLFPCPTPRLLDAGALCSPEETQALATWVSASLAKTVRGAIHVEAWSDGGTLFTCNAHRSLYMNGEGQLVFCCNLSFDIVPGAAPGPGRAVLADLHDTPLAEGVVRHYEVLARFMAARVAAGPRLTGLASLPCHWCLHHFGKLDWLGDYPASGWSGAGRPDGGSSDAV